MYFVISMFAIFLDALFQAATATIKCAAPLTSTKTCCLDYRSPTIVNCRLGHQQRGWPSKVTTEVTWLHGGLDANQLCAPYDIVHMMNKIHCSGIYQNRCKKKS